LYMRGCGWIVWAIHRPSLTALGIHCPAPASADMPGDRPDRSQVSSSRVRVANLLSRRPASGIPNDPRPYGGADPTQGEAAGLRAIGALPAGIVRGIALFGEL